MTLRDVEDDDGTVAIEAETAALGLRIDTRTAVTRWLGESLDYPFAVSTLMGIAEMFATKSSPSPPAADTSDRPVRY